MRNFQAIGRSTVMARNGMAASSHPLSTNAAVQILEAGGNAMDAAIAACAVQCVVEPGSTGIGGDCFALYSPGGKADAIEGYSGAGWAPQAATPAALRNRGVTTLERNSPHVVTVPGAIDAWAALLERHGSLSMARVLAPAIRLAEDGYVVSPRAGVDWAQSAGLMAQSPHAARVMLQDGKAPAIGSVHHQRELGATLRAIGTHGRKAFYEGPIAQDMVAYLQSLGGLHTLEDFASYRGEFVQPISTTFRGHQVVECPPPGQGIIALLLLNMLSRCKAEGDPTSADRLDLEIRLTRAAYQVRDAEVCDPRVGKIDMDKLMSEQFAAELLAGHLPPGLRPSQGAPHRDTVYLCVVDKDRNCVSFINSLFAPFGSGLMTPQTGIMLHNRGSGFDMTEGHPNCIGPRKRPLHSIIPGMVTQDGRVKLVFGVMGGAYQAMGHGHFLSKVLDYGLDLQAASDLPRVFPVPGTDTVEAESTLPPAVRQELERRGYKLVPPVYAALGGAQAILVDWENGSLQGASDHRKDGCAMGY